MARRRARTETGEFKEDNPETPDVNEAWEETTEETQSNETNTAPAVVELQTSTQESQPPEKASPEEIQVAIAEKLSSKTDSASSNPFVPNTQVENEVKEIAKKQGFPLNRGTEVGARLIAKSVRNKK